MRVKTLMRLPLIQNIEIGLFIIQQVFSMHTFEVADVAAVEGKSI